MERETIKEFREKMYRHIEIMNAEFGVIKTDIGWMKKLQWVILVGILASFLK